MTVIELRDKKLELEKKMQNLKFTFEQETDTTISKINVERHGFFRGDRVTTIQIEIIL